MIRLHSALALLLACPLSFAEPASPQANSYNFGTEKQGTKIVHLFPIANNTPTPLTIKDVELSMPGMKARFKPVVNPNAEGGVTVEWDTSHLAGEIEGQGVVHFADESRAAMPLMLK